MDIPREEYDRIVSMIESKESAIGIDAKHTHVLILSLLMDIDKRLKKIESNQAK